MFTLIPSYARRLCTLFLLLSTTVVADDSPTKQLTETKTVAGRTVAQYTKQLSDANRVVRLRAAKSLGAFGESAGEALRSALQNDDHAVQYIAIVHLGRIGGEPLKSAQPQLVQLAKEDDSKPTSKPLRMATAFALCRLGKIDTQLHVLTDALEHPDRGTSCSAAELIGMLGSAAQPAIKSLEAVHAQHKSGVKGGDYHRGGAAMNALRKIRGQ